jgi:hypothetical protein
VVAAVGSKVDEQTARIGARVMVHHYSGCGTCSIAAAADRRCVLSAVPFMASPHMVRTPIT